MTSDQLETCDWIGCDKPAAQQYGVERVHTPTGETSVGGLRVREGRTVHCCMKHGLELRRVMLGTRRGSHG